MTATSPNFRNIIEAALFSAETPLTVKQLQILFPKTGRPGRDEIQIIIEALIYIIVFRILGVPYFFVLGFLAGLTILLPFIGPIVSALLTVTVYYAVGEPSVAVVLMIFLSYFIMNGVIEQLFLYPALVGEALGLSVLETIIVVLVGGLVAGLPGVVFAVPTASVLKFLIPKLYAAWRPRPIQSDS